MLPNDPSSTLVAVYGTLRQGCRWNYLLAESPLLGLGWTQEHFALYLAEYPCVHPYQEISPIRVEVYRVSGATLANLDELEEHPLVYTRELTPVILDPVQPGEPGEVVEAWLYFLPQVTGRLLAHGDYALEYHTPSPEDAPELDKPLNMPLKPNQT